MMLAGGHFQRLTRAGGEINPDPHVLNVNGDREYGRNHAVDFCGGVVPKPDHRVGLMPAAVLAFQDVLLAVEAPNANPPQPCAYAHVTTLALPA